MSDSQKTESSQEKKPSIFKPTKPNKNNQNNFKQLTSFKLDQAIKTALTQKARQISENDNLKTSFSDIDDQNSFKQTARCSIRFSTKNSRQKMYNSQKNFLNPQKKIETQHTENFNAKINPVTSKSTFSNNPINSLIFSNKNDLQQSSIRKKLNRVGMSTTNLPNKIQKSNCNIKFDDKKIIKQNQDSKNNESFKINFDDIERKIRSNQKKVDPIFIQGDPSIENDSVEGTPNRKSRKTTKQNVKKSETPKKNTYKSSNFEDDQSNNSVQTILRNSYKERMKSFKKQLEDKFKSSSKVPEIKLLVNTKSPFKNYKSPINLKISKTTRNTLPNTEANHNKTTRNTLHNTEANHNDLSARNFSSSYNYNNLKTNQDNNIRNSSMTQSIKEYEDNILKTLPAKLQPNTTKNRKDTGENFVKLIKEKQKLNQFNPKKVYVYDHMKKSSFECKKILYKNPINLDINNKTNIASYYYNNNLGPSFKHNKSSSMKFFNANSKSRQSSFCKNDFKNLTPDKLHNHFEPKIKCQTKHLKSSVNLTSLLKNKSKETLKKSLDSLKKSIDSIKKSVDSRNSSAKKSINNSKKQLNKDTSKDSSNFFIEDDDFSTAAKRRKGQLSSRLHNNTKK